MVGKRRSHRVRPDEWSSDVDEDEVRAVATLAVEAYDPRPLGTGLVVGAHAGQHRQHIEPIRAALSSESRTAVSTHAPLG